MSDFLKGVGTGLAGSNGIARAVNNFTMAPYIAAIHEQRARSDAAVQALNEAQLAEINRTREGLETSRNYFSQNMGVDPAALQGATDYAQLLRISPKLQMMGLAGMFDQGRQPAITKETPATSSAPLLLDGEAAARAKSEANIRKNTALFDEFAKKYGVIEHAMNGGSMYQYQNNGAAFNPFYGTIEVPDQEVRNLYAQKERSEIARRQARTEPYQQVHSKPLPAPILKMQQEEMNAIAASASLAADLETIDRQIESGALDLGMVSNFINRGRNFTGLSSEQSRNYASLEANLERLRNESLRLNKGVQTEGDAQRAWNELVKNLNDPNVVRKRLREIININRRAIGIRKNNLDAIRSNYGLSPMQTENIENVKPSVVGNVLTPGSIEDGYEYLGGDPSQPASWRKR